MSWTALLASAVVAAVVSGIFTTINNRDNLYATYKLEQKKKLREIIGAYSGRMLEAATDWDRRMHQLYPPKGTDHMAPPEGQRHAHNQYLYLSVVFRFLSLLGIARKFESEAFYVDSRIARRKDLDFLRYAKSLLWVMTASNLTPDDDMPGLDHFRSDEFRPLLDVCYRREENMLPENEPKKGELVFDWARFRVLLDKSRKDYKPEEGDKELDQDTIDEIEQVLEFFDGIKPDEYDDDLRKRRRWERIICLHLLTICFIGTFGYSWQRKAKSISEKRAEAINALAKEALTMQGNDTINAISVLEAFRNNLYMTGLESHKRIKKITRKQISKLERDLTNAIDSLPQMPADARDSEQRALQMAEHRLGPDDCLIAVRLGNVARTYHAVGQHAEALPLEQRALQITENSLGADHLQTAVRLSNLARTYHAVGQHAEALPLEQRAQQVRIADGAAFDLLGRHASWNRGSSGDPRQLSTSSCLGSWPP
jgi:hypothetical protein